MTDSVDQASIGRHLWQLLLPSPVLRAVGTASIGHDQEFLPRGIELLSYVLPPASDTLHGKLRGLMVDTYIDKPLVLHQIIDAIRNRFPVGDRAVIIHIDDGVLPFGLPFAPVVLKIANQLFLLTIHRNHRLPSSFKGFPGAIDLLKLGISVGMYGPLNPLLVRFDGN